ncbi:MAG TPA: tetratricopeptide repeat protein [Candidatus Sulfotelmatobacter sp.]|jgi:tetratricopeptide (TPR) repeat protein
MSTTTAKRANIRRSRKAASRRADAASGNVSAPPARLHRVSAALALAVATLILYSSTGSHPFTNYDDPGYVLENSHVKKGVTWETLNWALTTTEQGNWHPLTWFSHALDCQFFGLDASGHHWTSVAIHALNVVLLFLLLQRITGATFRSFLVAALFAFHPLNVESVAWVAERKTVLSTLFFLLTLGAYGYYAMQVGLKRYSLVAGLFVLGLAAKPMLVTLPFVLLLMDYWPLCRIQGWSPPSQFPSVQESFSRLVVEKLPLMALSAGSAVVTVMAQRTNLAPSEQFSFAMRLENAAYSYWMYLAKAFWPMRLALYYPHPANSLPAWQWIGATLFLVAVSALVWRQASSRPYLLVGWLWFLGTLVPVLGIVQVGAQGMADRYAYIPLIGIFVAVVWGVKLPAHVAAQAAAGAIVLVPLFVVTWRQIGYWKSDYDLWSHTLAVTENNLIAEDKLGVALQAMGRQQDAITHFANAARLNPLDPLSNFSLGADLHWHGRLQDAIPHYEVTIKETTDARLQADAYQNLGAAYLQMGERAQARENFLLALKANPGLLSVFAGLGELGTEAARTLSRSVVQHPSGLGFLQLGRMFQQDGLVPEARLAYAEALTLSPDPDEARQALAALDRVPQ